MQLLVKLMLMQTIALVIGCAPYHEIQRTDQSAGSTVNESTYHPTANSLDESIFLRKPAVMGPKYNLIGPIGATTPPRY